MKVKQSVHNQSIHQSINCNSIVQSNGKSRLTVKQSIPSRLTAIKMFAFPFVKAIPKDQCSMPNCHKLRFQNVRYFTSIQCYNVDIHVKIVLQLMSTGHVNPFNISVFKWYFS